MERTLRDADLGFTIATRPFVRDAEREDMDGALTWRPRTGPGIRERRRDMLAWCAAAS